MEQFVQAYDQHADAIFRHCFFRVHDRERARDLMQETFTKTWKYMADGGAIENIRAFLYKVATRLVIDEWKKAKKESSLEDLQEKGFEPGAEDRFFGQLEVDTEAKSMLQKIDPRYRDVIVMRYLEELSPKEIGLILGESENAVSVRIHRGLKQVRHFLENENIENIHEDN